MLIEELICAKKDFLTGCFTKESLAPLCVKLGGEYLQDKKPFSILLLDLDHFKSINDKYGHLHGDEVLKYFSSSLRLSLGDLGVLPFRYGGDEFVVVFPGKNSSEARSLSIQLQRNIKNRPFLLKGRLFKMSFSGGIASYPNDGETIEDLINNADKAMYFSKRHGHSRITQYSKIYQDKLKRFAFIIIIILLVAVSFFNFRLYSKKYLLNIFQKIKSTTITTFSFKKGESRGEKKTELKSKLGSYFKVRPKQIPGRDIVYLKSGGICKGIIFYEDDHEIKIKLQLERGEGSMVINKSEIEKIVRGSKDAQQRRGRID